ncbi:MAG: phytoene desaturase family protein [Chthoniobacteraceae bacterium]
MARSVLIIGAGPGGLGAAMLLAKEGMRVTVVEQSGRIGGRTSAIEEGGYRFDVGPTFFMYPRVLEEIFSATGHDLHREVEMVRLDPQYRITFGAGGDLLCTPDLEQMERAVAALAPADAGALRRFMSDNREKLARFRPCMENPFLSWRDVVTPRILRLLPFLAPWRSLNDELGRYFSDPRIRLAFSFQSKYLGMSPFRCPSLFSILSFIEYEYGVFHPVGGCNAVTAAMARVARRLGVEFRLNEPVEELLIEGGRTVGIRTAAGETRADAVIVNADFADFMTRHVPAAARRRWSDGKIARSQYSCSTFMMYLGIEGCYALPHHSIYIARDYARNLEEIEKRHVLSADPSFYVQNACVTDPTLAPPGHSTLYVLVPVSHMHPNIDWSRERDRFRALAISKLAQLGITNLESRIRFEKITTPADWESQGPIYRGATFNLAHNLGQMLHLRPRNRFEDIPGTYLVGGGTHPGSGLPVIFESSRITSRLVLEDLGISPAFLPPAAQGA